MYCGAGAAFVERCDEVKSLFQFSMLQFEIELLDDHAPGDYWGSRLRGGFGDALLDQLCIRQDPLQCRRAPQSCECGYQQLFKPTREISTLKPTGAPLGSHNNLPAPFVINPPPVENRPYQQGRRLIFDFVALGPMCQHIKQVVQAFAAYGETGLMRGGARRARFALTEVRDLLGGGRSIFGMGRLRPVVMRNIAAVAAEIGAREGGTQLQMEFITQVMIDNQKAQKRDHQTGLKVFADFFDVIYNLTARVAGLWQLYGEGWPGQAEYYRWRERLLKASRQITILQNSLEMIYLTGYSNRKEAPTPLHGFVGTMKFSGDFTPFLNLLAIGEVIHIGNQTTYGLGRYRYELL
jgi:hypothetical protein